MGERSPDKDGILDAIRRVALELGRRPSRSQFKAHSGISEHQVYKHFLSWNAAVEAAGLDPDRSKFLLQDCTLLEDWGTIVRNLRQIPTSIQCRHHGRFSTDVLQKHFGSWSTIPDAFRQFAHDKLEWSDVIALLPETTASLRPPLPESADSEAGVRSDDMLSRLAPKPVHSKLENRPVYGNPIDFRGLRHEPVNENGVIFLFAIVARELGYSVEAVQQGFPDCEAKRLVGAGKWQRVRIEFEYESRSFREHGHPVDGCDVIVCWRHNWAECPQHIEVLELSEVIKRLGKSDE